MYWFKIGVSAINYLISQYSCTPSKFFFVKLSEVEINKSPRKISIGNSVICSDIWHKYHEWYFKIVTRYLRQFWNIRSGIYAKYQVQIMLLIVYTTTRKRFVIFTCRYFKLSWNTTALSQSNCRNFSCSSILSNACSPKTSPKTLAPKTCTHSHYIFWSGE